MAAHGLSGNISDMDQRDRDGCLNLIRQFVHGVGADQDAFCSSLFKTAGMAGKDTGCHGPVASLLQADNGVEIDRAQENFGGGKASQPVAHLLIDPAIVDRCAFPAHAANQADGFHHCSPDIDQK